MICDDCRNRGAVIQYPVGVITYYLCLECAGYRVEAMRHRMAYLTRAIRKVKQQIPESWQKFLKEGQTS